MIGIIIAATFISIIINLILKRFSLPTIIGYIATGTIIAYMFNLQDAVNNHTLREIAEFGVVFLMFTIGLEFSFETLKRMKKEVFFTGILQIVGTALFVYLISHYIMNFDYKTSMILGSALALSSTAIVLKTFNDNKDINKPHGRRVLGILIMQDIAVIPILLMISIFTMSDDSSIPTIIFHTIVAATILIGILVVVGKYLLEPFFNHVARSKSDELFVASVLFVAVGASYLAYYFGFSYSLGAFVAGMMIAETKFKHQVEADLTPFRNILLGIFFITVGMQINFTLIFEYAHIIMLLLPALILLKYLIVYTIVRLDSSKRVAFKTALSLVQMGEFSLAILELARSNNLIDPTHSQIVVITIILSMVLTPLVLKNLSKVAAKVIPEDSMLVCNNPLVSEDLKKHIIVLGYGNLGQEVTKELKRDGREYVVLEHNLKFFEEGQAQNEPILFGNAVHKHVLEAVNIKQAAAVVVAIDNPEMVNLICHIIGDITTNIKTIVKVTSQSERDILQKELKLKHIIVQNHEVAASLVKEIYTV